MDSEYPPPKGLPTATNPTTLVARGIKFLPDKPFDISLPAFFFNRTSLCPTIVLQPATNHPHPILPPPHHPRDPPSAAPRPGVGGVVAGRQAPGPLQPPSPVPVPPPIPGIGLGIKLFKPLIACLCCRDFSRNDVFHDLGRAFLVVPSVQVRPPDAAASGAAGVPSVPVGSLARRSGHHESAFNVCMCFLGTRQRMTRISLPVPFVGCNRLSPVFS